MKKIMFSDDYCLTKAVLDGTKTMTRRIVPLSLLEKYDVWYEDFIYKPIGEENYLSLEEYVLKRTTYKVGEVIAIAQSYYTIGKPQYDKFGNGVPGNSNKMFTRAELMPHHIKITDVRVERLQSISDEDILKEGVWQYPKLRAYHVSKATGFAPDVAFLTAREAFAYLIDRISGRGTWGSNPWVVAYEFKLID